MGAGLHYGSVSPVDLHQSFEGLGDVSPGQGEPGHPCSQEYRGELLGCSEVAGGAEEGEEGPVDGFTAGARLGKEGNCHSLI